MSIDSPYTIHFGLEYIKDDLGPTTEFPCKKKRVPKARIMTPPIITAIPIRMVSYCLPRDIDKLN